VAPFDRPLDAGNQHQPSFFGVGCKTAQIELALVQRDGQRVVTERRGMVDELERRIGNRVHRIVGGVRV